MRRNTPYKGLAAYGEAYVIARQAQLRERQFVPARRRLTRSSHQVRREVYEFIPAPPLVSEELFEVVAERLAENQRRSRHPERGTSKLNELADSACARGPRH